MIFRPTVVCIYVDMMLEGMSHRMGCRACHIDSSKCGIVVVTNQKGDDDGSGDGCDGATVGR